MCLRLIGISEKNKGYTKQYSLFIKDLLGFFYGVMKPLNITHASFLCLLLLIGYHFFAESQIENNSIIIIIKAEFSLKYDKIAIFLSITKNK
jgi:hypothetical protein